MIRVLVVDDAPLTLGNIERLLASVPDMESCGSAHDGDTALALVQQRRPDIVLIDMDLQRGEGLRTARTIIDQVAGIAVVVMGLDDDEATLQLVSDSGATDYLVKPFGGDELLESLRRVAPVAGGSGDSVPAAPGDHGLLGDPGQHRPTAQPQGPVTVSIPAPNPDNQIIVVMSGKGGVGTTVLATNIALLAANEARRRVGILDLDLQHGDVRRMLRVDPVEGIVEVAAASTSAERHALVPRLVDGPAGVMALLPPAVASVDISVSPEFTTALFLQMRSLVDIVVVDLPTHMSPVSVAAIRAADRIVLVSSMSDPGVRATQAMLRMIASLGVSPDKVIVTLNRNEANSDLTKPAVEEALGRTVPVQLPYDPILVSTSINRGAPFVLQKPDAQVSRKVRELSSLLFPVPQHPDLQEAPRPARIKFDEVEDDGGGRRKPKKKGRFW